MKSSSKLTLATLLLVKHAFFLALFGIAFASSEIAANNVFIQPTELTGLLAKAAKDGQVRVIIGMKLPPPGFKPEGSLSPAEVKQQRNAITDAREALLSSLSSYEVDVYAVYKSIPYVAMKVDADALKGLASSPYVTTIQEDSPKGLHEIENAVEVGEGAASKTEPAGTD